MSPFVSVLVAFAVAWAAVAVWTWRISRKVDGLLDGERTSQNRSIQ